MEQLYSNRIEREVMFVVDIVNGSKVYSKVCSSCRQDTDYYQLEDEYYNFIYLSDCCNAEC